MIQEAQDFSCVFLYSFRYKIVHIWSPNHQKYWSKEHLVKKSDANLGVSIFGPNFAKKWIYGYCRTLKQPRGAQLTQISSKNVKVETYLTVIWYLLPYKLKNGKFWNFGVQLQNASFLGPPQELAPARSIFGLLKWCSFRWYMIENYVLPVAVLLFLS